MSGGLLAKHAKSRRNLTAHTLVLLALTFLIGQIVPCNPENYNLACRSADKPVKPGLSSLLSLPLFFIRMMIHIMFNVSLPFHAFPPAHRLIPDKDVRMGEGFYDIPFDPHFESNQL